MRGIDNETSVALVDDGNGVRDIRTALWSEMTDIAAADLNNLGSALSIFDASWGSPVISLPGTANLTIVPFT